MSSRPPPPPPPSDAMDFVEDLLATEELEALARTPIAALDESIRRAGHDPEVADAIVQRVLAERSAAAGSPAEKEVPPAAKTRASTGPPPASNVVHFTGARVKRRSLAPWLLAAAALIAVIDVALTHKDAIVAYIPGRTPPGPSVPSSVPSPPPSTEAPPQEIAADLRAQALRSCAMHLFDTCQSELDRAKELDPQGETAPEVKGARDAIAEAQDGTLFEGAKPGDRPHPRRKDGGAPRGQGSASPQ